MPPASCACCWPGTRSHPDSLCSRSHIGAVLVPMSPLTKPSKLAYMLQNTRATALLTHAALQAEWEEAVKAYVTLRPGARLSEREVFCHCLASLESFMAPRQVEFVDALPCTDSGKIRRASLRSEGS